MTLPTPEEVASIILTLLHVPPDYFLKEKGRELIKIIIADRSRLIQHIREKIQKLKGFCNAEKLGLKHEDECPIEIEKAALEAVEKILEGIT